jgi:hypothetical protein
LASAIALVAHQPPAPPPDAPQDAFALAVLPPAASCALLLAEYRKVQFEPALPRQDAAAVACVRSASATALVAHQPPPPAPASRHEAFAVARLPGARSESLLFAAYR